MPEGYEEVQLDIAQIEEYIERSMDRLTHRRGGAGTGGQAAPKPRAGLATAAQQNQMAKRAKASRHKRRGHKGKGIANRLSPPPEHEALVGDLGDDAHGWTSVRGKHKKARSTAGQPPRDGDDGGGSSSDADSAHYSSMSVWGGGGVGGTHHHRSRSSISLGLGSVPDLAELHLGDGVKTPAREPSSPGPADVCESSTATPPRVRPHDACPPPLGRRSMATTSVSNIYEALPRDSAGH